MADLFAALSQEPPNEVGAFEAMKAGARLTPGQLVQLSAAAIALYGRLLGLVELTQAALHWAAISKQDSEQRQRAAANAKRILEGAANAYGKLAWVAIPKDREPAIEPEEEDRDHGLSM